MQVAYEVDFGEEQGFGDITWGLPEVSSSQFVTILECIECV